MKLNNKTILVTGAGGGIGGALVEVLLAKGAKVVAIDLRQESLDSLTKNNGDNADNITTFALDISDKSSVFDLPEKVVASTGQIDGVINCAGIIQPFVKVNDLDFKAIDKVMGVNFYGTLYMTKAFLPYLIKRPEALLVNVSSMGGFLPVPGQAVYGASKAAVKLMTEGLYAELKDSSVQVTVVFPGATSTDISKNSGVEAPDMPEGETSKIPMISPHECAELIVKGIEKGKPPRHWGRLPNCRVD